MGKETENLDSTFGQSVPELEGHVIESSDGLMAVNVIDEPGVFGDTPSWNCWVEFCELCDGTAIQEGRKVKCTHECHRE